MSTPNHPLIERLCLELLCDPSEPDSNLNLGEPTVQWLTSLLGSLGDVPAEQEETFRILEGFAQFLEAEVKSPNAASSIRFALEQVPAYVVSRSRAKAAQVEEAGRAFTQFLGGSPSGEIALPVSDDPKLAPVSAAELMRRHMR